MIHSPGEENSTRRTIPPPSQGITLIPSGKGVFKDVRICDILVERSHVVEGNILRIYLKLAPSPPVGWAFKYNTLWESISYPDKVTASAQDGVLWIECEPNEFAAVHLPQLEAAVALTNEAYRPSLQHKASVEQSQRQIASDAQAQLEKLRRVFDSQATNPPQVRTKSSCVVGIAMSAFCLLWCLLGLLPVSLLTRWRTENPLAFFMIWLAVIVAAAVAAIADFRKVQIGNKKKE